MSMLMKAIVAERAGDAGVLKVAELERPVPGPTEVLVRVHATSVNPHDCKTRARGRSAYNDEALPLVLGFDVSGVVEAVGSGVTILAPGDEVFGFPKFPHHARAYAEYVCGPARHFAPKPAGMDHIRAAGLPLAGLTAWQALVDTAQVRAGRRVLVHAAAGGVGHLAVQIAKARGAVVIGTARSEKHAFLRQLGADQLIDYTQEEFDAVVSDVDVVLDTLGGDVTSRSLTILREGGVVVTIIPPRLDGPPLEGDLPTRAGTHVKWMLVEPDGAALRELATLVDAGKLRVELDSVFPLTEMPEAHRRMETGRATGKVAIRVVPSASAGS
jgi:NADPH:quinone reductase-like Zn-dependent oxidoreductase